MQEKTPGIALTADEVQEVRERSGIDDEQQGSGRHMKFMDILRGCRTNHKKFMKPKEEKTTPSWMNPTGGREYTYLNRICLGKSRASDPCKLKAGHLGSHRGSRR
ncbi:MAG: hypothetical protein LBI63_01815 [Candidatus Ancillula sp.]|nr:hypothetical protein [Candidatus Ancillula sp.]